MNVFDIIGPVMIGPSSSHTAGAVRLGRVAWKILGDKVVKADITLSGSFAQTYRGHGTDKALIAGVMGMDSDDERIRHSLQLAKEGGMEFAFHETEIPGAHPNTARVILTDADGRTVILLGSSIGGGNILVREINGMDVSITGQHTTLIVLHRDAPGTIASVTEVLADAGVNICNFRLSREQKGGQAVMTIEIDGSFGQELNDKVQVLPNIFSSTMLQPI